MFLGHVLSACKLMFLGQALFAFRFCSISQQQWLMNICPHFKIIAFLVKINTKLCLLLGNRLIRFTLHTKLCPHFEFRIYSWHLSSRLKYIQNYFNECPYLWVQYKIYNYGSNFDFYDLTRNIFALFTVGYSNLAKRPVNLSNDYGSNFIFCNLTRNF